jgi:hypothetical protein
VEKLEVIARIEEGRRAFEDTLLRQSEDALNREGTLHDWSVKDVVAHLTFWQRLVSARLASLLGESHDHAQYLDKGETVQQLNDATYPQIAHIPAADILTDSQRAHAELIALVQRLPDDALARTDLAWTQGDALWAFITNDGSEHFIEHSEDIERL